MVFNDHVHICSLLHFLSKSESFTARRLIAISFRFFTSNSTYLRFRCSLSLILFTYSFITALLSVPLFPFKLHPTLLLHTHMLQPIFAFLLLTLHFLRVQLFVTGQFSACFKCNSWSFSGRKLKQKTVFLFPFCPLKNPQYITCSFVCDGHGGGGAEPFFYSNAAYLQPGCMVVNEEEWAKKWKDNMMLMSGDKW